MKIRIEDGNEFIDTVGFMEDDSDELIVSPRLAKKTVLEGIGKMTKIKPLSL